MYIHVIHTIPIPNSNPFRTTTTNNNYDAAFPQRVANVMNPQRVPLLVIRCSLLFISRYLLPVTRYCLLYT